MQNVRVIHPGRSMACLLALLLAGCGTAPRRSGANLSDWQHRQATAPLPSFAATETASSTASPPPPPTVVAPPVPATNLPAVLPVLTNDLSGTWISLNRWCQSNGLALPRRMVTSGAVTLVLQAPKGRFTLSTGGQRAYWNGLELNLGFTPQLFEGTAFVHALDLRKTIQPLLNGGPEPCPKSAPVVVIDPGHGGVDVGTSGSRVGPGEKYYTLDWALRLGALLATNGWQVYLTRTNDVEVSLSNRVTIADERKADLFVSLHFNSATQDARQEGLETYCLTPAGMPSSLTRGYGDDASVCFPNNAFDEHNIVLAARVHRALLEANGYRDRGIRRARFLAVLRGQQRPAILVEGGYLSNPREARQIADPAHRQKLAEAMAKALLEKPKAQNGYEEAQRPGAGKEQPL